MLSIITKNMRFGQLGQPLTKKSPTIKQSPNKKNAPFKPQIPLNEEVQPPLGLHKAPQQMSGSGWVNTG